MLNKVVEFILGPGHPWTPSNIRYRRNTARCKDALERKWREAISARATGAVLDRLWREKARTTPEYFIGLEHAAIIGEGERLEDHFDPVLIAELFATSGYQLGLLDGELDSEPVRSR